MTGIGAYFYIMWGLYLRHCINGKQDDYELYWPSTCFSIPVVLKKPAARANGQANGQSAGKKNN